MHESGWGRGRMCINCLLKLNSSFQLLDKIRPKLNLLFYFTLSSHSLEDHSSPNWAALYLSPLPQYKLLNFFYYPWTNTVIWYLNCLFKLSVSYCTKFWWVQDSFQKTHDKGKKKGQLNILHATGLLFKFSRIVYDLILASTNYSVASSIAGWSTFIHLETTIGSRC